MNAQWNMSFSGEASNNDKGKEAFESAFAAIRDILGKFALDSDNHHNDNGQFYLYDEDGNATSHNIHESDKAKPAPAAKAPVKSGA